MNNNSEIDPRTTRSARGHHAHFFLNLQRDRSEIIPVSVREAVAHISLRREAFDRQRCDYTVPSPAEEPHNPFVELQRRDEERRAVRQDAKQAAIMAKLEQRHRPMTGGGASVSAKLRQEQQELLLEQQQQRRRSPLTATAAAAAARSTRPHSSPAAAAALMSTSSMRGLPSSWEQQRRASQPSRPSPRRQNKSPQQQQLEDEEAAELAAATIFSPHLPTALSYDDIPVDDGGEDDDDEVKLLQQQRRNSGGGVPLSSSRPPSSATAKRKPPMTSSSSAAFIPTSPSAARPATSSFVAGRRSGAPIQSLKEQLAAACEVPGPDAKKSNNKRGGDQEQQSSSTMIRRIHSAGTQRVAISSPASPRQQQQQQQRPSTAASVAADGTKDLLRKLARGGSPPLSPKQQQKEQQSPPMSSSSSSLQRQQSCVIDLPTSASVSQFNNNNNNDFQPQAPLEEELLRAANADLAGITTDLFAKTLSSRGTFHSLVNWADGCLAEALGAAENEKAETEPGWVAEQLAGIPELRSVTGPGVSAVASTLLVLNSIMTIDPAVHSTWGSTWNTIRNVLIAGLFGTDGAYRVSQEMLRGMTRFRLSEEEALARALSCVPSLTEAVQNARVRCAVMKKKLDSKDQTISGLDLALAKHIKDRENKRIRLIWRAWREHAAKARWQRWAKAEFSLRQSHLELKRRVFSEWRRVGITLERLEAERQRDAARLEAKHAKLILHKSIEDAKATLHEEVTTARRHLAEERSLRQAQVSALTMETERLLGHRHDLQDALEHFSSEGRLWHNLWQEHRPRYDLFSLPVMSTVVAKSAAALHDAMAPLFARSGTVALLVAGDAPLIAPQTATVFGVGSLQQTAHNRTFTQILAQTADDASSPPPTLQLPVDTQRNLTRTKNALSKFLLDWANGFLASIPQHQQQHEYHDDDDDEGGYSSSLPPPAPPPPPLSRVLVRDADFADGIVLSTMLRHLLDSARTALLVPQYPRSLVDKITHVLSHSSGDPQRAASAGHAVLNLFRVALDVFSVFPLFPALVQNCPYAATHFTPTKILAPEFSDWWQYLLSTLFVMYATLPVSIGFAGNSSASGNSTFLDAVDTRMGEVVKEPQQQQQQQQTQQQHHPKRLASTKKNISSSPASSAGNSPLLRGGMVLPAATMAFSSDEVLEMVPVDPEFDGLLSDDDDGAASSKNKSFLLTPESQHLEKKSDDEEEKKPRKLTKQQKRELTTLSSRGPVPLQCLLGQHHFAHHVPAAAIPSVGDSASSSSSPLLSSARRRQSSRSVSRVGGNGFLSVANLHSRPSTAGMPSSTAAAAASSRRGSAVGMGQRTMSTMSSRNVAHTTTTPPSSTPRVPSIMVSGRNAGAVATTTTATAATRTIAGGHRANSNERKSRSRLDANADGITLTSGTLDTHLAAMQSVVEEQQRQWKSVLERWQSQIKWESLFKNGNDVAKLLLEATSTPVLGLAALDQPAGPQHQSSNVDVDGEDDDDEDALSSTAQTGTTPRSSSMTQSQSIRGPLRFFQGSKTPQQHHKKQHSAAPSSSSKFALPNPAQLEAVDERRRCWEQTVRQRAWYSAARLVASAVAEFHVLEWLPEQNSFRSIPTPVFTTTTTVVSDDNNNDGASSRASSSSRGRRRSAASTGRRRSMKVNSLRDDLGSFVLDASSPPNGGAAAAAAAAAPAAMSSSVFGSPTLGAPGSTEHALSSVFERSAAATEQQHQEQRNDAPAPEAVSRRRVVSPRQGSSRRTGSAGDSNRREQQVSVVKSMLFTDSIMNELKR